MYLIGIVLQVSVLWFLITLFTGQRNSTQSFRESFVIILAALIVNVLTRIFLGGLLGPLTLLIDFAVLYFLVDKLCGTTRKVTLKICGWYVGISLLISLGVSVVTG